MPLKNKPRQKLYKANTRGSNQPDSIDAYVGRQIRAHRMLRGMKQEELAESIGIKFQQLQKYEVASNKCSISRLVKIAEVLNIPLMQLLGEYVNKNEMTDMQTDWQSIKLIKDYQSLPGNLKRVISTLATSLAEKNNKV